MGFNNTNGAVNALTYDGVALTQAAYRAPVAAPADILFHGIYYLDDPTTSTGTINVQASTRASVSAFLLTGTADGHGASAIGSTGSRSVSLTTTQNDSMVISSFAVGGNGNTGNTDGIDTVAPLTEISAIKHPSNWQGHVVGNQTLAAPVTETFEFSGGDASGGFVIAAEFTAEVVPEPSSILLVTIAGLTGLYRRRRQ